MKREKIVKFKVKDLRTGRVYLPEEVEILFSPNRVSVHDLNGIEIEEFKLFRYTGRTDSHGKDLFAEDLIQIDFVNDDDQEVSEVMEIVEFRGFSLFNADAKTYNRAHATNLDLLPRGFKVTLL